MEKINVAELLKDCPKGMELYSPIFGTVYFDGVRDTGRAVLIDVKTSDNTPYQFYTDGKFNTYYTESEMTLFPSKDVRTWEGFVPPCNFKDGDIVATNDGSWIGITTGGDKARMIPTYCIIKGDGKFEAYFNRKNVWSFDRLATEEEKQTLFKAIIENGYTWNAGTKTLEKLVEPKFDTTTLKPFDKVLVRDKIEDKWMIEFFSHIRNDRFMFACATAVRGQCVPYEGNEHLLDTTDNCEDFYVTW